MTNVNALCTEINEHFCCTGLTVLSVAFGELTVEVKPEHITRYLHGLAR